MIREVLHPISGCVILIARILADVARLSNQHIAILAGEQRGRFNRVPDRDAKRLVLQLDAGVKAIHLFDRRQRQQVEGFLLRIDRLDVGQRLAADDVHQVASHVFGQVAQRG